MKRVEYVSAGGVVIHNGHVLLLDRPSRGEVRLPKGHVEAGESIAAAALRETTEESGYADLVILADLGSQLVEFDYKGKHFIRTEHYYLMRLGSPRQIPRNAKDAADFSVLWVPCADAAMQLTYEAERNIVRTAIETQASLLLR